MTLLSIKSSYGRRGQQAMGCRSLASPRLPGV